MPRTIAEAVRVLIGALDEKSLERIQATSDEELVFLHPGLGAIIRDEMRLWAGNQELLAATGAVHPDDASMLILRALKQELICRTPLRPH